jgi:hypothetical protein
MSFWKMWALNTGLSALYAALQDPRIRQTVKGICLEILRQIQAAFPGDPDFQ